jgi:hypothetical protein
MEASIKLRHLWHGSAQLFDLCDPFELRAIVHLNRPISSAYLQSPSDASGKPNNREGILGFGAEEVATYLTPWHSRLAALPAETGPVRKIAWGAA